MRFLPTILLFVGACDALRLNPQYNTPAEFLRTDAIPWNQDGPIDLLKKEFLQNPQHNIIDQASRKLENVWPHIDGREFLKRSTSWKPAGDGGRKLRARLKERFQKHETFTFAAFGSSVTAGHDGWLQAAWPAQLERILKPTFEKLGMNFEARNRGMGGYGEMPYASGCLHNRAGDGVDALSWEWGMFGDSACERSSFLREASGLERNPVLFNLVNVELQWRYRACPDGHCAAAKARHNFLEDQKIYDKAPEEKYRDPEEFLKEDYISQDKLNLFEDANKDHAIYCSNGIAHNHLSQQLPAGVGEDIINLNIEAATKPMCNITFYQAREKLFNTNWHPGPLGHYVIASQVAHYILENLMQVVEMEFFQLRGRRAGPTADNPLVDQAETLTDSEINSMQCGNLMTAKCWTGVEPNTGSLKDLSVTSSTWKHAVSPQTKVSSGNTILGHLDKRYSLQGRQDSGSLEFHVNVEASEDSHQYLLFCGTPCGWQCNTAYGYFSMDNNRWWNEHSYKQFSSSSKDDPDKIKAKMGFTKGEKRKRTNDFAVEVDGQEVSTESLDELRKELFHAETGKYCRNCPKLSDMCQPVAKLSRGEHTIALRVDPKTYADQEFAAKTLLEVGQVMLVE